MPARGPGSGAVTERTVSVLAMSPPALPGLVRWWPLSPHLSWLSRLAQAASPGIIFSPRAGVRGLPWAWLAPCRGEEKPNQEAVGNADQTGPAVSQSKRTWGACPLLTPSPGAPAQAWLGAAVPPFPTPDLFPTQDRTNTLFVPGLTAALSGNSCFI